MNSRAKAPLPMEDNDATIPVPAPIPRADGGASPEAKRITDSRMADLLLSGADALAQRSTPPGGWQPPSVEAMQAALPQYEISAFIARGGMGAVYKGTQKTLKRDVAIKVLPPEADDGEAQFTERFKREAQAMARLSHPNIVAVHDAGETTSGLLYFVMEFIEGTDVARLIASEGKIDTPRTVQIITAVCDALAFAHEEGIIHRDIKPSNIMLDRKGRVKVADFGLAKTVNLESTMLTGSNVAMGTPDFIAPEALIPGIAVDGRADLYAVGVMIYQMLTGKIPRGRFDSPSQIVPKMDKSLDAIVDKAMQTDRDKRYSTASELKRDVEKVAAKVMKGGREDTLAREKRKAAQGKADTPVRSHPPGTEASKQGTAGRSARAPLIAGAVVVVGLSAWFITARKGGKDTASGPVSSSPSLSVSASYAPQPAAIKLWDAAEKLPADTATTSARWDNGTVKLTGQLRNMDAVFRNGIVRASVRMNPGAQPQFLMRHSVRGGSGTDKEKTSTYSLYVSIPSRNIQLGRNNNGEVIKLQEWPFPRSYATNEWVRLEVRLVNDEITVTADGQVLGTVRDPAPLNAGNVAIHAKGDAYFRDIEYVPLDGVPAAMKKPSTSPSWQKLPLPDAASLRVQGGGAATINAAGEMTAPRGLLLTSIAARNIAIRGEARRIPDSTEPVQITLRVGGQATGAETNVKRASRGLLLGQKNLTLQVNAGGDSSDGTKYIPILRREYPGGADLMADWAAFEFTVIGDASLAMLAGMSSRLVGHAQEAQAIGNIQLMGGQFRKLEYINLDGVPEGEALKLADIDPATISSSPAVSSSPSLPLSKSSAQPAAIKLWDAPDKLDNNPKAEWKDGAVHLTESTGLYARPLSRDGIIRASIRMNADAKGPQVQLRHLGNVQYRLALNPIENYAVLAQSKDDKEVRLKQWPLPRRYREDEWVRLELRAIGDQLTALADGKELGTVTDIAFQEPGTAAIFATNGYFRDIEYVPLDKPPVSTSPRLPISQSSAVPSAAKADAAWKARWHKPGKLRAAGVDRLGKALDLKAAEPFDDFVQMTVVDPNYYNGRSWAALRSTGDLVWSDGFTENGKIGLVRSQAGVFSIGAGGTVVMPIVGAPEAVFDVSSTSLSMLPSKPWVMAWADEKGAWHLTSTAYDTGLIEKPDLTSGAKVSHVVVANQAVGVLREDGTLRVWSAKEIVLPATLGQDIANVLPLGELWVVLKKDGSVTKFRLRKADQDGQIVLSTEAVTAWAGKAKAITSGGFSPVFLRNDGRWTADATGLVEDSLAKLNAVHNEAFSVFRDVGKEGILWIEPTTAQPDVTAIWKARWSKPGRLRGLGVDAEGKPIDMGAAGEHVDFVMVSNFAHAAPFPDGKRWLALRANGDAVSSDGSVEPGCIGLPQGGNRITADGRVRLRSGVPPPGPMRMFRTSTFDGAAGIKLGLTVLQTLDGTWKAQSLGYDDGTLARPDLASGPEIKKAEVMPNGLGVLRADGSFRLWGVREVGLPANAATGIQDFASTGRQLVVLRKDGSAWTLKFPDASAVDPSAPPTLYQSGNGIAIASAGFSAMLQKPDGTWFPQFTTDAAITDALAGFKKKGVTHFSAASNKGMSSLLWIEPVAAGAPGPSSATGTQPQK